MLSEPQETEQTQGLSTTTTDQIEDPEKVVNINKDKLANLKDSVITTACKAMEKVDIARAEKNAEAASIRASLKNKGIPPEAFDMAYKRYKMGPDKRAGLDAAFAKCCKALDIAYQADLFGG